MVCWVSRSDRAEAGIEPESLVQPFGPARAPGINRRRRVGHGAGACFQLWPGTSRERPSRRFVESRKTTMLQCGPARAGSDLRAIRVARNESRWWTMLQCARHVRREQ